jgi:nitrogen fixation/metabolism regulation signal transduction histidine kinase
MTTKKTSAIHRGATLTLNLVVGSLICLIMSLIFNTYKAVKENQSNSKDLIIIVKFNSFLIVILSLLTTLIYLIGKNLLNIFNESA